MKTTDPFNPFCIGGEVTLYGRRLRAGWYYSDETGDWIGPYRTEWRAKRNLKGYVHWLEHGPTRWQRIWLPVKWWARAFWRDTSSDGPLRHLWRTRHDTGGQGQG